MPIGPYNAGPFMMMQNPNFWDLLSYLQPFCQKCGGHANTFAIEAAVLHNSNCDLQRMLWNGADQAYNTFQHDQDPETSAPEGHKQALVHYTIDSQHTCPLPLRSSKPRTQ